MTDTVLQGVRGKSLVDDSHVSEAELHADHDHIREVWQRMQEVKAKVAQAKQAAIEAVNKQYADELSSVIDEYSLILTLTR